MSMNRYIYDKVNKLINKYKTRDPMELIEAMHIKIMYLNETNNLLGMYKYFMRNRFIFISPSCKENRKTILAHELGHDQLHRETCKSIGAFHEQAIFNPTNKYETEANIFAAHLLISDDDVLNSLRDDISDYELAGELGVDINLLNLKISEMAKMGLFYQGINVNVPQSDFLKNYRPEEDDFY